MMKFELFENIITDSTSKYTKIKKEDYLAEGQFPIIDQGQEFIGGYTNDENLINKISDEIIIFGDHTKVFKLIDFPIAIGADGVKVLQINKLKAYPKFVYYYFRKIKLTNAGYSRHFKFLKDVKIPLPLLSDQIRIAQILSQAESLIAQRKQSISLLDELLKSTFLEMFGDPVRNEKKFESKRLDELCDSIFLGLTSKVDYVDEGGFPLIRTTDINGGKLSFDKAKYISENQHKLITKNRISKRGDLLVSKSGTLGTCAIVDTDREFTTYESIITIQSKKHLLHNYFLIYLIRNENYQIKMLGGKVGGTVGHLNLLMFRNMSINLPPIELQNKFANIVEKVEALKTQYQQSLTELQNMYGVLSQKAFRGELKGNVELEMVNYKLESDSYREVAEGRVKYKKKTKK